MMLKINQKRACIRIVILLFLSVVIISEADASRFVKIATIGGIPSFSFDRSKGSQSFVDQIIVFWKNQINQVLSDKPDLILLPEICDIPTNLNPGEWKEYLQVRNSQVTDQFSAIAKANHCYIAYGTMRIDEDGKFRNSAILLDREGKIAGIYNKNFPTIGEVDDGIKAGDEAPVFQCDFGRVAFAICFDLNFKELLAKYEIDKPDIILFPSNYHGGIMQNVWAYWCRSFFVGSINGGGTPSEIRNPLGEVVAGSTNYFDFAVANINLDSRVVHLGYNFGKLDALKKKYGNAITITDPGRLGPVLVSSEDRNYHIDDILKEFDIELIDPYFNRSREKRAESLDK
ncbi:MAG: carbon-nitrogen hydrolase family protein [Ferruginibacter sp.]